MQWLYRRYLYFGETWSSMGKITLVSSNSAKVGYTFTYLGQPPECKDCPIRGICHNLIPGRRYRVIAVREKQHECEVHSAGKVSVVEYEEIPQSIAISRKSAVEGAVITLDGTECPAKWCGNLRFCSQKLYEKGQKVKILEVNEKLECPRGRELMLVTVRFLD
jgi:uncharacterized protein (UPF0179 family)